MSFIPYGKQWIDENDIQSVIDILRTDWITQGPMVDKFEEAIADFVGVKYAVAFNSGTSALHSAMFAAGVEKNDSIITSPLTFVATSNSAVYLGAKPIFVDIDMKTYCINLEKIRNFMADNTKVIAPVDFAGYPVNLKRLREITEAHDLVILEDAAHALGARRYGKNVGQEADMTMFSFHPVKHITTGEGGVVVTDNEEYFEKMRVFRTHGLTKNPDKLQNKKEGHWYYEMHWLGYNYRITDLQCALGLSQLRKLDRFLKRRNEIAKKYDKAFQNSPNLAVPPTPPYPNSLHAYHIYPLLLKNIDRKSLFNKLRSAKIYCQVHYIPVHLQPYYRKKFGFRRGDYPQAESFYENEITIPLYPKMTEKEIETVINTVQDLIK